MPPKKVCNLKSNDNPSVVFSQQLTSRTLYIRHFKSNSNSWIWRIFCCRAFHQTLLKSCILRTIYGCAFYKHETAAGCKHLVVALYKNLNEHFTIEFHKHWTGSFYEHSIWKFYEHLTGAFYEHVAVAI